jgi:hypothetical protein
LLTSRGIMVESSDMNRFSVSIMCSSESSSSICPGTISKNVFLRYLLKKNGKTTERYN